MQRIFLDFEMNMVDQTNKELKAMLPHEIIEIGAVKMDESCRVTDRFRSLVRPRYNKTVHWSVRKLTGLTEKKLRTADYLEEVLPRFVAWVGTEESVRLYAWSESDRAQLERECTYKNLWDEPTRAVFAHWTDFQRVFTKMIGYRNAMALGRAVEYMGLTFGGSEHDAQSDAENCARLMALALDTKEFERRRALIPPEPAPRPRAPVREAGTKGEPEKGKKTPARGEKASTEKATDEGAPLFDEKAKTGAGASAPDGTAPAKKRRRRSRRRAKKTAELLAPALAGTPEKPEKAEKPAELSVPASVTRPPEG